MQHGGRDRSHHIHLSIQPPHVPLPQSHRERRFHTTTTQLYHINLPAPVISTDIAREAERFPDLLTPDEGCAYDRVIEIDLSTLEPLVNGPYTPDLANPISQLGRNAEENGWPLDIKVG